MCPKPTQLRCNYHACLSGIVTLQVVVPVVPAGGAGQAAHRAAVYVFRCDSEMCNLKSVNLRCLQVELAKPLIALLQRGYHERQATLRPNVPQVRPNTHGNPAWCFFSCRFIWEHALCRPAPLRCSQERRPSRHAF